jgi:hypothetical protein
MLFGAYPALILLAAVPRPSASPESRLRRPGRCCGVRSCVRVFLPFIKVSSAFRERAHLNGCVPGRQVWLRNHSTGLLCGMFPYSFPDSVCLSLVGQPLPGFAQPSLTGRRGLHGYVYKVGTIKAQGSLWRAWRSLHSCHLQLATSRKMRNFSGGVDRTSRQRRAVQRETS